MSTVADILDRAADHLQEHGWLQGELWNDQGRCCVVGAIIRTAHSGRDRYSASKALLKSLGEFDVPGWNDAPERTADEVIAALREAARRERVAA